MPGIYGGSSSGGIYGSSGKKQYSPSLPSPKSKSKEHKGFFGKASGLAGHFAHDVGALKGIPMGLGVMAKALYTDVKEGPHPLWTKEGQRRFKQDVKKARPLMPDKEGGLFNWVWPMLPGTKGGVGEGLHRAYEHPLAPVLDVVTLATLGAGSAAKVARLAAPASRIARASEPTTRFLKAPLNDAGLAKGQNVPVGIGQGSYVNPLVKGRRLATHNLLEKAGVNARRWERQNHIEISRSTQVVESSVNAQLGLAKQLVDPGPERHMAQTRIVQHIHSELSDGGYHLDGDVLTPDHLWVMRPMGPELVKAANGHGYVPTKTGWEMKPLPKNHGQTRVKAPEGHGFQEYSIKGGRAWKAVKKPPELVTMKELKPAAGAGWIVNGKTAELVHAPKKVAPVPEEGAVVSKGGPKITRYADGRIKKTTGANLGEGVLGKTLKAPEGKVWAKAKGADKWRLIDDTPAPKLLDEIQVGKGMEVVQKGKNAYHEKQAVKYLPALKAQTGKSLKVEGNKVREVDGNQGFAHDMDAEVFGESVRHGKMHKVLVGTDKSNAVYRDGRPIAVPKKVAQIFGDETKNSMTTLKTILDKPQRIWKTAVLATPRYLVNNVIGSWAMGLLNDPQALKYYANGLRQVRGHHKARQMLEPKPGKGVKWMDQLFSHNYGHGFAEHVPGYNVGGKMGKVVDVEKRWYSWVNRHSEEAWRVAAVLKRVRNDPEIIAGMKRGMSEQEAVMAKHYADPTWRKIISDDVDDVFGQYHYLNKTEGVMRTAVPFYGWYRAISRSTFNTFKDRPGRFYAMTILGEHGRKETEKVLGAVPRFMEGAVPLGKAHGDRIRILSTAGMNPYQTPVELVEGAAALMGGGGRPGESLGGALGPVFGYPIELMSGNRMLTGEPHHKGALKLLAENFGVDPSRGAVPPLALINEFLLNRKDQPGSGRGESGRKYTKLYDPNKWRTAFSVAGVPIKQASKKQIKQRKKQEDPY